MTLDQTLVLAMFDIWYWRPILAMLYLTYDTRDQYLPCYIWHMILETNTCHAIFDTWHMISVLAMLYLTLDIWHRYLTCYICHMIYNTWYLAPDTWLLYYLAYAWLLLPDIWYSCISCIPVLLYLLYLYLVNSTVRPASGRACLVSGWRGCIPQSC